MQHHDAIKIDHILGMIDKKNVQEWTDHLTKLLFTVLNYKPLILLKTTEINFGSYDEVYSGSSFKVMKRNKQTHMVVQVETISLQKYSVRRVLKHILPRIDQDLHDM